MTRARATLVVTTFLVAMAAWAQASQASRVVVGADGFAWFSLSGPGWTTVTWNKEDGVLRGNGRPLWFEDKAGMHPDSSPRSAGRAGLWVDETRTWEVYVEAAFSLTERGVRQIRIVAVIPGVSSRVLATSVAEPADQINQHRISLEAFKRIDIGEALIVQVRAHDNGVPVNVGAKGVAFAVW